MDSAAYAADLINACQAYQIQFAIGADLDVAVRKAIAHIPATDWVDYRDGQIAETVHCMNKTRQAFRLIVLRRARQADLFEAGEGPYRYTVMASNRQRETDAQTWDWYGQRGEHSENRIKDLKSGLGMERMPCGQFAANAVYFRIGVLAYNLFVLFKQQVLDNTWRKHQIQTLRWRLYQVAGKVVRHAGAWILKVGQSWLDGFAQIRAQIWARKAESP